MHGSKAAPKRAQNARRSPSRAMRRVGRPAARAARAEPQAHGEADRYETSVNGLGIHDGDLVAVRAAPEARDGEIVIARFGDEATMKRFRRVDARHVELHPESDDPEHEVMHIDLAKHILHIDGVVVGHLRGKSSVEAELGAQ